MTEHGFDFYDWPERGSSTSTAVCRCSRRFVGINGELAHQLLEAHVADETARALHPSRAVA